MISSRRTTPTTMSAMAPLLTPPLVTNAVISDAGTDDRGGATSEDLVGVEGAKSEDMEEGVCVAVEGRATVLSDVPEPVPDPGVDDRLGLVSLTRLEDVKGARIFVEGGGLATVSPDVIVFVDWGGTA